MMKGVRLFAPQLICAAVMMAAEPSIPAQVALLQIDPAQSKIAFTLGATAHTVHGSFQLKRSVIRFDSKTGQASGELVVDAASGNTGSASRDKKMHSDVLESAKYSEIIFRPDRVEGAVAEHGTSQVQLHGIFAIHGAEHELTIPITVDAGDGQYTASTTFSVPYVKWGMKNPSTFFLRVSDKIEVSIRTLAKVNSQEPRP
jgi:polyisoprenoid-binding protein YceI